MIAIRKGFEETKRQKEGDTYIQFIVSLRAVDFTVCMSVVTTHAVHAWLVFCPAH